MIVFNVIRVKGTKDNVSVDEVPLQIASLYSNCSFVLDNGKTVYVFNGPSANIFDRKNSASLARGLNEDRHRLVKIIYLDDDIENKSFWELLGGQFPGLESIPPNDKFGDNNGGNNQSPRGQSPRDGEIEYRLLRIKGKTSTTVKEMPLSIGSLNQRNVFVLDAGPKIYVFYGPMSQVTDRKKAADVARGINELERRSFATLIFMDDHMDDPDFWRILGGTYTDPRNLPDDEGMLSAKAVSLLYVVNTNGGEDDLEFVASYPFKRDKLTSDKVYFLHTASNNCYLWIGKQASRDAKLKATAATNEYIKFHSLPPKTIIERVSDGWYCIVVIFCSNNLTFLKIMIMY